MLKNIELYFLLFLIYSFFGWLMEIALSLFESKKIVNRGFLIGPYCSIYGYGVLLITLLLEKHKGHIEIAFIMIILICGILEYFTSYFMEKLFKAKWWDYSDRKFNINGRVCLINLLGFGILGSLVLYLTNPVLLNFLYTIPKILLHIMALILGIIYLVDCIISFNIIINLKNISKNLKDNTEEISQKVNKAIRNTLYGRLTIAFPLIDSYFNFNERKINKRKKIKALRIHKIGSNQKETKKTR